MNASSPLTTKSSLVAVKLSCHLFLIATLLGGRVHVNASSPLTTKRSLVAVKLSCHLLRNNSCLCNLRACMNGRNSRKWCPLEDVQTLGFLNLM